MTSFSSSLSFQSFAIYIVLVFTTAFATMIFMDWWFKIFIEIQVSFSEIIEIIYIIGFLCYGVLLLPKVIKFANKYNNFQKLGRTVAIVLIIICSYSYFHSTINYINNLDSYSNSFFLSWLLTFFIILFILILAIYSGDGTIKKPNIEWETKYGDLSDLDGQHEISEDNKSAEISKEQKEIIRKESAQKAIADFFEKNPEKHQAAIEEFKNNQDFYLKKKDDSDNCSKN